MTEFLEPEKIYNNYIDGNISKGVAADLLITLIENSDFYMKRIESLEIIDKIGLRTEKIFKTLENWVVSDEMQLVRAVALRVLANLFPQNNIDTLKWLFNTIKHADEYKSHLMFATLIDLLYWCEEKYLRDFRSEVIKKLKPIVQNYVEEGVISNEAVFLALFEIQNGTIKIQKVNTEDFQQLNASEHMYFSINNAGHIVGIYIRGNILFIPQYLYYLKYLEELELIGTFITFIPESIGKLEALKVLNLSWNYIKSIPNSIGSLLYLKQLKLTHNKIQTIPESFGSLTSLESLNLGHNKLNRFPESICLLRNLKSLYLYRNKIETIPFSIKKLYSLKKLDLWNNNIQTLPELIGELTSLKILNLGHNKIQKIPNSISSLHLIKKLDLRFNNIEDIPESLTSPAWLKKMILEGNKIKNLSIFKDR